MAMIMSRALSGTSVLKFAFGAFTAFMLAGCSDSIERFSENYSNPSDQDPVYTASVPRYYKKKSTASVKQWEPPSASDDQISEEPIAPKAPYQPKIASNDYANSYKQTYQQPAQAAPVAPAYPAPKYAQPKLANNTLKAPVVPADPVYDNPAPQPKLAATPRLKLPAEPVDDGMPQVSDAAGSNKVTMKPGMTLYGIARTNHLTVQQLAAANNIKPPYVVTPGRVLTIPTATAAAKPAIVKDEAQIDDSEPQVADNNATKSAATPVIKKPAPLALPKEPAPDVATTETPADANPQLALRCHCVARSFQALAPRPTA